MRNKILVIVTTVAVIIVNLLSNVIPYNNKTTAEISDSFPIYFVPAGYVFSIWGLIYIGLIAYTIYQYKFLKQDDKPVKEISSWYVIAGLANSIWLFLWHYEFIVATSFMMLLLLISLLGIYMEIKKNPALIKDKKSFWMLKAPFSLYLGWISVATIANLSSVFYTLGFSGNEYAMWWSVGMMVIGGILAMLMIIREKDYIYAGVLAWAFIGIGVKFNIIPELYWAAISIAGIIIFSSIISKIYKKNKKDKV